MLLLGLLSILQTIFLPGFIFLYIFNIKTDSKIQKWIYVFAFSLFVNYALVTILVTLSLYKQLMVFILIGFEVLCLFYLLEAKKIKINLTISFRELMLKYITFIKSLTTLDRFLVFVVSLIVLFYSSLLIANIGTIFYFVDTVYNLHWNTWATDFSNNMYPRISSHFPQLIPANWSLSYLITGEPSINFFPKSYMPLFFLSNLLLFLDLAIQKRKLVYLFGLIIYGLFAPIIYNLVFIADGNGDLPVSFFTFLAFYAFLKTDKTEFKLKEYLLVFLFASTVAGTKLAGFYIFFFLSIVCLYQLIKNYKSLSKKEISTLTISVILILVINLFWYFQKPKVMASGLHQPEWLVEGYINIVNNALHLLYYNFGLPVLAFLAITFFFSLFTKKAKYVTLMLVIPPIILWMFKYSSDFRNLSFVVPFIAYTSAFGLNKIIEILTSKKLSLNIHHNSLNEAGFNKKNSWLFILFILIALVCFFIVEGNFFYQTLYSVYSFISKFYFQSNRITYLIDFTFFLPVDYYQKVFAMMFLLPVIISVFYLINIKVRDVIIILILAAVFLNFTFITKSTIFNHQKEELLKVEARNYYQTINTIVKRGEHDKTVYTNFKPISTEVIQSEISFIYLDNIQIKELIKDTSKTDNIKLFVKKNILDNNLIEIITNISLNNKPEVLFEDNDYIFLELKKKETNL